MMELIIKKNYKVLFDKKVLQTYNSTLGAILY